MTTRFAVAALLGACAGSTPQPDNAAAPGAPEVQIDLRSVDWKSRTYVIPPGPGDGVDLIAGEYRVTDGKQEWDRGAGDRGWFVVGEPRFGDVNGDGDEEAIVIATANGGGSGAFSAGLIFDAGDDGEPIIAGRIPGGDRGAGGLVSIEVVEPGVLRVVRNWLAGGEGALESSLIRVERWRWRAGGPVEDESAREIKPDPR